MDLNSDDVVDIVMHKVLADITHTIPSGRFGLRQQFKIGKEDNYFGKFPENLFEIYERQISKRRENEKLEEEREIFLLSIEIQKEKLRTEYFKNMENKSKLDKEANKKEVEFADNLENDDDGGIKSKEEEETEVEKTESSGSGQSDENKGEGIDLTCREGRKNYEARRRQMSITRKLKRLEIEKERKKLEEQETKRKKALEDLYKEYEMNKWLLDIDPNSNSNNRRNSKFYYSKFTNNTGRTGTTGGNESNSNSNSASASSSNYYFGSTYNRYPVTTSQSQKRPTLKMTTKRDQEDEENKHFFERTLRFRLALEEIYISCPLNMLSSSYRKLDLEMLKIKDILDKRLSNGNNGEEL